MNGDQQTDPTPKGAKRAVNKLLVDVEEDLHDYKGGCLFVTNDDGTYCDEPVTNNCHIVSESAVLDGMKDDKTKRVLELQWGVSQWRKLMFNSDRVQLVEDPTTFGPAPSTTHNACVGRFACKQRAHDDEFQPIDVAEPDFGDPVVRFLAAYRSMLFFTDQCRQSLELHGEWNRDAMKGPNAKARVLWLAQKAKLEKALREAEANVTLLGRNWHARKTTQTFDPDLVSARVLGFRSKLRIAGCVYYGETRGCHCVPNARRLAQDGRALLHERVRPSKCRTRTPGGSCKSLGPVEQLWRNCDKRPDDTWMGPPGRVAQVIRRIG